jgi:hypothetical protein
MRISSAIFRLSAPRESSIENPRVLRSRCDGGCLGVSIADLPYMATSADSEQGN